MRSERGRRERFATSSLNVGSREGGPHRAEGPRPLTGLGQLRTWRPPISRDAGFSRAHERREERTVWNGPRKAAPGR